MMPASDRPPFVPRIRQYQEWLRTERDLGFDAYEDLWRWSVTDLPAFWQSVWDFEAMYSPTPHAAVLAEDRMPGAVWFPGAQVNYAQRVLRHVDPATAAGMPAIVAENEAGEVRHIEWLELRRQVAAFALAAQDQIAQFLASGGLTVIDPDGPGPFFETPMAGPPPEDLAYIP